MTRIIFIGDIHGCYDELQSLLLKCSWDPKSDRLILLGDLVDRGSNSGKVVRWARENNIEVVRGNHDDRYVKLHVKMKEHEKTPGNLKPTWLMNYPDRIKIYNSLSEEDHTWLANTPIRIFIPEHKIIAVHAGIHPAKSLENQEDNSMMHVRFLHPGHQRAPLDKDNAYSQPKNSYFWADHYNEEWNVVYGHHVWSEEDIKIHANAKGYKCYGIDTGCCFGGRLTALVFNEAGAEPYVIQTSSSLVTY